MQFLLAILFDIFEQGFIYGIMALGVYISYKTLSFPDISVDGTFPLGAAVSAILITNGMNPWLSLLIAILAGLVAGAVTGILHVKFQINKLFSGIIVMTILYSLSILIARTPNLHLFGFDTIFNSSLANLFPAFSPMLKTAVLILSLLIVLLCKFSLDYFLQSQKGLLLRACGDKEQVVLSLGEDPGKMKILGLALSNGLVALSGAVFAQQTSVFNVSMGTGTMTTGLASVIIGTVVFSKFFKMKETTAVLFGAVLYKALVSLAINLGARSEMLNLIRGLLFFCILLTDKVFQKGLEKVHAKHS